MASKYQETARSSGESRVTSFAFHHALARPRAWGIASGAEKRFASETTWTNSANTWGQEQTGRHSSATSSQGTGLRHHQGDRKPQLPQESLYPARGSHPPLQHFVVPLFTSSEGREHLAQVERRQIESTFAVAFHSYQPHLPDELLQLPRFPQRKLGHDGFHFCKSARKAR